MKVVARGFTKWIISYAVVVFVMMIMPVFLITNDISTLDSLVNYLFNNKQ